MMARAFVLLGAAALLAGCSLPGSSSACNAQIDWVNFVQVGSTQYVESAPPSPPAQEADLGPVYSHVKFKVAGNVCDPNYRPRDGDAAFLDPGTAIYQLNGRPPAEQLAAHLGGRIAVFRAMTPAP